MPSLIAQILDDQNEGIGGGARLVRFRKLCQVEADIAYRLRGMSPQSKNNPRGPKSSDVSLEQPFVQHLVSQGHMRQAATYVPRCETRNRTEYVYLHQCSAMMRDADSLTGIT